MNVIKVINFPTKN